MSHWVQVSSLAPNDFFISKVKYELNCFYKYVSKCKSLIFAENFFYGKSFLMV